MPRAYQIHTAATVRYLQTHWPRQPMREIAAVLGIAPRKLFGLARRQGLRKRDQLRALTAQEQQQTAPAIRPPPCVRVTGRKQSKNKETF